MDLNANLFLEMLELQKALLREVSVNHHAKQAVPVSKHSVLD